MQAGFVGDGRYVFGIYVYNEKVSIQAPQEQEGNVPNWVLNLHLWGC